MSSTFRCSSPYRSCAARCRWTHRRKTLPSTRSGPSSRRSSGRSAAVPHLPESGLNWAAAYLTRGPEPLLVVTTTDAGWLPLGTIVPAGVRVLWNVPTAAAWSTVDDPVRQLVEFAAAEGYAIHAVATTHPSRAHHIPNGPWKLVGERHPGQVLPRRVTRFELVASPERVAHLRSLGPDEADRQARALLRDLERVTVEPEYAIGVDEARAEARATSRRGASSRPRCSISCCSTRTRSPTR